MLTKFKNIINRMFSSRMVWGLVGVFAFVAFLDVFDLLPAPLENLVGLPDALAQSETKETNILQKVSELLATILLMIYILFFPLLSIVGALMEVDFVMGGPMQEVLRTVWIMTRDIANIIFVFILLFVAFVNIVGFGDAAAQYELKKMLPRIIAALVLVNFTFFLSKVAIDAVNITTVAIYSIPERSDITEAMDKVPKIHTIAAYDCDIDRAKTGYEWVRVYKDKKGSGGTYKDGRKPPTGGDKGYYFSQKDSGSYSFEDHKENLEADGIVCYFVLTESKFATGGGGGGDSGGGVGKFVASEIPYVIASSFSGLVDINTVSKGVKNYGTFGVNAFFQLAMFIILFFAFLALMIALVVRVAVLWVFVIMSPLVVVHKLVLSGTPIGGSTDLLDVFIKYLIIPIKIAATMVIGFIMVTAIPGFFESSATLKDLELTKITQATSTEDSVLMRIGDKPSLIQHVLYVAMILGVLWVGVTWAFSGHEYTRAISDKVMGAGKWVLKSPQYMPIPMTKGMNLASLKRLATKGKQAFEMKMVEEPAEAWADKLGIGDKAGRDSTKFKKYLDLQKTNHGNNTGRILVNLSGKLKSDPTLAREIKNMDPTKFKKYLQDAGFDKKHIDELISDGKDTGEAWQDFAKNVGGEAASVADELKSAIDSAGGEKGSDETTDKKKIGDKVDHAMIDAETKKRDEGGTDEDVRKARFNAGVDSFKGAIDSRFKGGNAKGDIKEEEVSEMMQALNNLKSDAKTDEEKAKIMEILKTFADDSNNGTSGIAKLLQTLAGVAKKKGADLDSDVSGVKLGRMANADFGLNDVSDNKAAVEALLRLINT